MAFVCHYCGKSLISEEKLRAHKGDYDNILFDFKTIIELNIHVIIDLCSDYLQWTTQTIRLTNAEFIETAHSTFKMSERIHKFKISRKIGTPVHNSKRAGFVSPSDFRRRKSSPSVWGSPLSSPR